jgi:hypothetical protein
MKTVSDAFTENFNFWNVRSTSGGVNYDQNGNPYTQWYFGKFWNNSNSNPSKSPIIETLLEHGMDPR